MQSFEPCDGLDGVVPSTQPSRVLQDGTNTFNIGTDSCEGNQPIEMEVMEITADDFNGQISEWVSLLDESVVHVNKKILRSSGITIAESDRSTTTRPSRAEEMRLKRLRTDLEEQKKLTSMWKNKYYQKVLDHEEVARNYLNKIDYLQRRLSYCETVFKDIKNNLNNLSVQSDKNIANKVLLSADHRNRAPCKEYSLINKYYKKKFTSDESAGISDRENRWMEKKSKVIEFFLRDENSRPAPGIHEVITRKKRKMRKRYLSDTILNLYRKFCDEHGKIISRAFFYKLKPFWVVRLKVTERDTTACKDHENFQYIFEKLRYHRIISANNLHTFITSITCDYKNKSCMYGQCSKCKSINIELNVDDVVTWHYCWVTEQISRKGSKGLIFKVKLTRKKKIVCSLSELVKKFNGGLRKFLIHVYRSHHQYQAFDAIIKNLSPRKVHVIVDWSMNFEGKYTKEIHATHFGASKTQISLHTGVFFYVHAGKIEMESFCTVSDSLRHDACAVWAHLQPVIGKIKSMVPDVEEISYQSDGPTTQYRNKTNFFLFNHFSDEYELKNASWHFSESGHSKGRGDGVGGGFKESLNRGVCCGRDILCADDIINFMQEKESKINVFKILLEDIEKIDGILRTIKLETVKGTMKIRQVVWQEDKKDDLTFRYLTCNVCSLDVTCTHYDMPHSSISFKNFKQPTTSGDTELQTFKESELASYKQFSICDFRVEDWVVVIFDRIWYPGVIKKVTKKKILIRFTEREEKKIWWPSPIFEQSLFPSQILLKIECLKEVKNSKGEKVLKIKDKDYDYTDSCAKNCSIYE